MAERTHVRWRGEGEQIALPAELVGLVEQAVEAGKRVWFEVPAETGASGPLTRAAFDIESVEAL